MNRERDNMSGVRELRERWTNEIHFALILLVDMAYRSTLDNERIHLTRCNDKNSKDIVAPPP